MTRAKHIATLYLIDALAPTAVTATGVLAMLALGGASIDATCILGVIFGCFVVLVGGLGTLRSCGVKLARGEIAVSLIVGIVPPSILIVAAVLALGYSSSVAFLAWSAIAIALHALTLPHLLAADARKGVLYETAVLAVLTLLVILWARSGISAFPKLQIFLYLSSNGQEINIIIQNRETVFNSFEVKIISFQWVINVIALIVSEKETETRILFSGHSFGKKMRVQLYYRIIN